MPWYWCPWWCAMCVTSLVGQGLADGQTAGARRGGFGGDDASHTLGARADGVHDAELSRAIENVGAHRRGQAYAADHAKRQGNPEEDQDDRTQMSSGDRISAADRVRGPYGKSGFGKRCLNSASDGEATSFVMAIG